MILATMEHYEALAWLLRQQANMDAHKIKCRLQRVSTDWHEFTWSVLTNRGEFDGPHPRFPAEVCKLVLASCGVSRRLHNNRGLREELAVRNGKNQDQDNLRDVLENRTATSQKADTLRIIKEIMDTPEIMFNERRFIEALTLIELPGLHY